VQQREQLILGQITTPSPPFNQLILNETQFCGS